MLSYLYSVFGYSTTSESTGGLTDNKTLNIPLVANKLLIDSSHDCSSIPARIDTLSCCTSSISPPSNLSADSCSSVPDNGLSLVSSSMSRSNLESGDIIRNNNVINSTHKEEQLSKINIKNNYNTINSPYLRLGKSIDHHIDNNIRPSILILYGTESGKSKLVAEKIQIYFNQQNTPSVIISMNQYVHSNDPDLTKLATWKYVIMCCSTIGGDPPRSAQRFFRLLRQMVIANKNKILDKLKYTIITLGNSMYGKCSMKSGKDLDILLTSLGAQSIFPIIKINEVDNEWSLMFSVNELFGCKENIFHQLWSKVQD